MARTRVIKNTKVFVTNVLSVASAKFCGHIGTSQIPTHCIIGGPYNDDEDSVTLASASSEADLRLKRVSDLLVHILPQKFEEHLSPPSSDQCALGGNM